MCPSRARVRDEPQTNHYGEVMLSDMHTLTRESQDVMSGTRKLLSIDVPMSGSDEAALIVIV